jgi:hypothetical protein
MAASGVKKVWIYGGGGVVEGVVWILMVYLGQI